MEELKRTFRPEFINRTDSVIVFHALSQDDISQIVDLELDKVRARLEEFDLTLEVTAAAKALLSEEGYDEEYGARPLRRVIQSRVEDKLSDAVLVGKFAAGDTVCVDSEEDEIVLYREEEGVPAKELALSEN